MIALIFSIGAKCFSQKNKDLFSFNYTMVPVENDAISFKKLNMGVTIPITTGNFTLLNSASFTKHEFDYKTSPAFNIEKLSNFNQGKIGTSIAYQFKQGYSAGGKAYFSLVSNFDTRINKEDIVWTGGVFASKKWTKSSERYSILKIGISYETYLGKPKLLPEVSYFTKIDNQFSIRIGFPNTEANYQLNKRNSISLALLNNGFYANISQPVYREYGSLTKAEFSKTSLSLAYDYAINPLWTISLNAGYILNYDYNLFDAHEESAYRFETSSKPFFTTGIKFNLSQKTNQNK